MAQTTHIIAPIFAWMTIKSIFVAYKGLMGHSHLTLVRSSFSLKAVLVI